MPRLLRISCNYAKLGGCVGERGCMRLCECSIAVCVRTSVYLGGRSTLLISFSPYVSNTSSFLFMFTCWENKSNRRRICPTITTEPARLTVLGPPGAEGCGRGGRRSESSGRARSSPSKKVEGVREMLGMRAHRSAEDGPLRVLGDTAVSGEWGGSEGGGCWPGQVQDHQGEVLGGEGTPWSLGSGGRWASRSIGRLALEVLDREMGPAAGGLWQPPRPVQVWRPRVGQVFKEVFFFF